MLRRVLMTTEATGGMWTCCLALAEALGHADVEVILASLGPPPAPEQRRDALALGNVELVAGEYRLEWMAEPWQDLPRAARWLTDLAGEAHPDVVHLNGYALAAATYEAPTVVAAHACVASWWEAVRGGEPPEAWGRYRRAVAAGLQAADCVVAPTTWMLRQLERHYGFRGPAQVIPDGLGPSRFTHGDKARMVFAAGQVWDEARGLAVLDAAAARIGWPVLVAGEAVGGAPPGHLNLLGRLPPRHVADWLSSAAIFVLPARYAPFGLSALEAALSGCALVLGDLPNLRELWGEDAVFVRPDDADALAAALERLIADAQWRRLMATRAARRAAVYSAQRMATAYLALYRRLGKARSRRRAGSFGLTERDVRT